MKNLDNLKKKNYSIIRINVWYTIFSGCISLTIRKVLDSLIYQKQSGFQNGRYIGEDTKSIYDVMFYTELKNNPCCLVLLNFEE